MEEKTEARLVAEVLAGSGEAFASLVQRYQEYAYGVAVGLLTDFELARDVVQEAFMAAYRDLGKLKEPERFGGWLHGIVRHMSFRALRDLDRVRGLTEELRKADFAPAPSRRPDETAEDEEQRRIVSEALNRSRHRKATHSAGLLIGDSSYHVSVHHTLLAHNDFRNPLISGGGTHDFVNNVVYNWGALPAEITDWDSNSFLNFVGNYFIRGPSTQTGPYEIFVDPDPDGGTPKIFVEGNLGPHRAGLEIDEWALVGYGYGEEGVASEAYRSTDRFPTWPITEQTAADACEAVLSGAGATLPVRDLVDQRVVEEVRSLAGAIIDSPDEVGGYPTLAGGTPPVDSDHDGMPDDWERAAGLDPDDPADGKKDADGDEYTNLEEYLHHLIGR